MGFQYTLEYSPDFTVIILLYIFKSKKVLIKHMMLGVNLVKYLSQTYQSNVQHNQVYLVFCLTAATYILNIRGLMSLFPADGWRVFYKPLNVPPLG